MTPDEDMGMDLKRMVKLMDANTVAIVGAALGIGGEGSLMREGRD